VMAAFTNLALSASQLGTSTSNRVFVIEARVAMTSWGCLMILTTTLALVLPVLVVWALQRAQTEGGKFRGRNQAVPDSFCFDPTPAPVRQEE